MMVHIETTGTLEIPESCDGKSNSNGKNDRDVGRKQHLMSVVMAGTFEMLEACSEKTIKCR